MPTFNAENCFNMFQVSAADYFFMLFHLDFLSFQTAIKQRHHNSLLGLQTSSISSS